MSKGAKTGIPARSCVSIKLTESVVFTRGVDSGRRRNHHEGPPSIIRGLLTLELSKPTKISSIDVELQGKTLSAWPEGTGARRIEVSESHRIYSSTITYFRAKNGTRQRPESVGPGLALLPNEEEVLDDEGQRVSTRVDSNAPQSRRVSLERSPIIRPYEQEQTPPYTPPYTPMATTPVHEHPLTPVTPGLSPVPSMSHDNPAQTLEDFRNALRVSQQHRSPSLGHHVGFQLPPPSLGSSSSSSIRSRPDLSLSRRPSIEDVPEDEAGFHGVRRASSPGGRKSRNSSQGAGASESRGRRNFSLTNVFGTLKDRVRSSSPGHSEAKRKDASTDREPREPRGRTMEKGKGKLEASPAASTTSLGGKFSHILRLDSDEHHKEPENSKEFQAGVYTYPISFTIPSNSPPTLSVSYGAVTWKLKANVHRPGAFTSKLSCNHEVTIIASPGDQDTEDSENILVERNWDMELQYLIGVSGRSFFIGGSIPITFALMPLSKVKLHRISVVIEEKVEYTTNMKTVAKTDIIRRLPLLNLKSPDVDGGHILPLSSDNPEAFLSSPLAAMVPEGSDASEEASQFMGPGPWKFSQRLPLPTSCSLLHFTNRNRRSNILVTHTLRIVMRVQRGGSDSEPVDPKTGKPKLFDIVVQTPIHILSCRCSPQWQGLPLYAESPLESTTTPQANCPCIAAAAAARRLGATTSTPDHGAILGFGTHHHVLEPTPENSPIPSRSTSHSELHPGAGGTGHAHGDSLLDRNTQFERLVSGQESASGDAPPTYDSLHS